MSTDSEIEESTATQQEEGETKAAPKPPSTIASALASNTKRWIDITSDNLLPEVYNSQEFHEACLCFIKNSRRAQMRILISNPDALVRSGHKLMYLARRFTSFISIRVIPEELLPQESEMICDLDTVMRFKEDSQPLEVQLREGDKGYAQRKKNSFNALWERSQESSQLKQVYL